MATEQSLDWSMPGSSEELRGKDPRTRHSIRVVGRPIRMVVTLRLVENDPASKTASGRTKGRYNCLSWSLRSVQIGQRSKWHSCLCHLDYQRARYTNGPGIKRKSFRVLQITKQVLRPYLLLISRPQVLSRQQQPTTREVLPSDKQKSLVMSLVVIAANAGALEVNRSPIRVRVRLVLGRHLVSPPRLHPRTISASFLDLISTSKPWKSLNKTSRRNAFLGRTLASSSTRLQLPESVSLTHQLPPSRQIHKHPTQLLSSRRQLWNLNVMLLQSQKPHPPEITPRWAKVPCSRLL